MFEQIPNDWHEPIDLRPRYRVRRVAFFLASAAMALYAFSALCFALATLGQSLFLWNMLRSPWWVRLVGLPLVSGRLIASLLLLGRWADPSWRSRSSLLALLSLIDVGYWSLEYASALGLPFVPAGQGADGLGLVISRVIGIIELTLLASLGSEITTELGWFEGLAIARVAKATAGVGLTLWLIVAVHQLDWRGGFPPRFLNWRDLETYLIFIGSLVARAVSAFLVAIICSNACALCSRKLLDLERERKENDPFRSRSEMS